MECKENSGLKEGKEEKAKKKTKWEKEEDALLYKQYLISRYDTSKI